MRHFLYTALTVGLAAANCPLTALDTDNYHEVALLQAQVGIHEIHEAVSRGANLSNASDSAQRSQIHEAVSRGANLSSASDSATAAKGMLVLATNKDTRALVETGVPEVSALTEIISALIWCLVVAFAPFILAYLNGETLSWRAKVSSFLSTCWVIYGIITCKCVLFSSSHFKGNRTLSLGESVYFMSQIITTVGYGDISPANTPGQGLVAILVLWAILIVADSVSQAASIMANKLEAAEAHETKDPVSEQKTHLLAALFGHVIFGGIWVKKGDTPKSELQNVAQNTLKEIIPVPKPALRVKARAITDEEKEKSVYKIMKKARTNQKYDGIKRKKAEEKGKEA